MKYIEIYPKFTREQKLSCKLSDNDILEIRELNKSGYSSREIGELFGVSSTTVLRWLKSDEKRREDDKKLYENYGKFADKKVRKGKFTEKDRMIRKEKILGSDTVKKYYKEKYLIAKNNPDYSVKKKMANKSWAERNKKRIRRNQKIWTKKNIEKVRKQDRERKRKYALLKGIKQRGYYI